MKATLFQSSSRQAVREGVYPPFVNIFKQRLFLPLLLVLFLASCSDSKDEPQKEDPQPTVTFPAGTDTKPVVSTTGGTSTLTFKATAAWTATVGEGTQTRAIGWLSVSPTSGSAGEVTLNISTQPNDTYDERNASITIACGGKRETVTVTQKQKDALLVGSNKAEVPAEGGTLNIELKANVNVDCIIASEAQEWVKLLPTTRGLTTSILNFQIMKNEELEKRQAVILLKGGDNLTEQITVYQEGSEPVLILTQKEYTVGSNGETIKVELKSNTRYEVQILDAGWIMQSDTRALSTYTHYFNITPNDTYDARMAEIIFTDKENGLTERVTVYQVQRDAIVVAKNEYDLPCTSGKLDFKVQTNLDLEVSTSAEWIRQVTARTRGLVEMDLSFDIDANENKESDREAVITIKGKNSDEAQTVIVRQSKYEKKLVSTTYDMYMAWEVRIFTIIDGKIYFRPAGEAAQPGDWYDASFTPVAQRIRTYSDGSVAAEAFSDYGHIITGADIISSYYVTDNLEEESWMPEYDVFTDPRTEDYKTDVWDNDGGITSYYGSARDVYGIDFKNIRLKEIANHYLYYDQNLKKRVIVNERPHGRYDLHTLNGGARVYFTTEQVEKLTAYFGKVPTIAEVMQLTAGKLVEIMGTGNDENPYLGIPSGTYSMGAYANNIAVAVEGAGVTNDWGIEIKDLCYGMEFHDYDGFFVENDWDTTPQMQTYPKNIGSQSYKIDSEIVSDDEEKTVGVLKFTITKNYEYENTRNGFPKVDNSGIDENGNPDIGFSYDGYRTTFKKSVQLYDTLVCYKYKKDAPFRVPSHYWYTSQMEYRGYLPIKVNPCNVDVVRDSVWVTNKDGSNGRWEFTEEHLKLKNDIVASVDKDWLLVSEPIPLDVWQHESTGEYFADVEVCWQWNYDLLPRTGHITIGMEGTDHKETVRVVQQGGSYTEVDQSEFNFDYRGGQFTVTGKSTWPEKVSITWEGDWIQKTGGNTRAMTEFARGPLTVLENTSTEPRSATITVWEGKYSNVGTHEIVVTQDGCPAENTRGISASPNAFWHEVTKEAQRTFAPWHVNRK